MATEDARGQAAQTYYRCRLPAMALTSRGSHQAMVTSGMVPRPDGRLRGLVDPRTGVVTFTPDVLVLRMLAHAEGPELIGKARAAGQRVLYDIDDPVWWLEEHQPAYGKVDTEAIRANMLACDGVLAATDGVAEMVREACHPEGAPPITVARNGIDVRAYPPRPVTYGRPARLRIGWPGRTSHRGHDLELIAPVLRELVCRGDVDVVQLGAVDGDPSFFEYVWGTGSAPGGPVTSEPWVPLDQLPKVFASVDLAVLPQAPSRFAFARSWATGLAMAAAGTPFVSSYTTEYADLSATGIGVVCRDEGSWRACLDDLYHRPSLLRELSRHGRLAVARYDIRNVAMIGPWIEAIG